MDAKRLRSREILWAIWRQVEKCQSVFLSPSDLQAFGIQASQVDITDDGVPHFEPRFFEPHPEGVLQKYPIDAAENNYDIRRLDCVPTLQDALDTVQENPPVAEDPLEAAQKLFKDRLESYNFWENYSHASWIHDHIEYELESFREGGPPLFCLEDIAGLQSYVRDGERDPPMYESWSLSWKSEMFQEDHNETSPLPHAICTIVASVDATVADQDLTLHEMRAIMRMIAIRARGSFRKHPICPLLLVSYMGKQHGRITQIVVEEGRIVLQYSKLWSFEVEDTAPVELFIRYIISQPVGLERPSAGAGLLVDPVAGMHLR